MSTRYLIPPVLALALGAAVARGQSVADRVASARGSVSFEMPTRANVCGDGSGVFVSDDSTPGWNTRPRRSGSHITHGRIGEGRPCETGPARITMGHDGPRVTSLRLQVGGAAPDVDARLGTIPSDEGVRYLASVAPTLDGRSADDAVTAMAVAAVAKVWVPLLAIARDDRASEASRKSALFWVSREAAQAAVDGLGAVAQDDDASTSVRSDALFYLAQRGDSAGIDALVRVVRESKSARLRKDAVWYLAQKRDPRVLALFEELLAGREK